MLHKPVLSWRGTLLGVLASLAAVGLAIPATAAAKVTPLTSCTTIFTAGTYRLDADVVVPSDQSDCFDIFASNVTLNLNGHTINGLDIGNAGILMDAGADRIVGPGTLTAWGTFAGIELRGANGSVRGVTVTASADGMLIDSDRAGNDVRGNVLTSNSLGIEVVGGATGNTIIGNSATGNGTDLVDDNGNCTSNVWRGNTFGTANPSCIR